MIFYKVIIISSTCVIFLVNLDDYFTVVCTSFHEGCGFHQICSLVRKLPYLLVLNMQLTTLSAHCC